MMGYVILKLVLFDDFTKKNVSFLLVKSGPFWDIPFEVSKNQAFQKSEIADFFLKFLICSRNT